MRGKQHRKLLFKHVQKQDAKPPGTYEQQSKSRQRCVESMCHRNQDEDSLSVGTHKHIHTHVHIPTQGLQSFSSTTHPVHHCLSMILLNVMFVILPYKLEEILSPREQKCKFLSRRLQCSPPMLSYMAMGLLPWSDIPKTQCSRQPLPLGHHWLPAIPGLNLTAHILLVFTPQALFSTYH